MCAILACRARVPLGPNPLDFMIQGKIKGTAFFTNFFGIKKGVRVKFPICTDNEADVSSVLPW